jgi:hypothetical protein
LGIKADLRIRTLRIPEVDIQFKLSVGIRLGIVFTTAGKKDQEYAGQENLQQFHGISF